MSFRLRIATLLLLALASVPALAIRPFNARYTATYMGVSGNAQMSLAQSGGNRWRYALTVGGNAVRLSQTTVFDVTGEQWRPLSGTDASVFLIRRTNRSASYDWARGEARWSGDIDADRTGPVPLQAGDMDALLINLALARDAASGRTLSYRMVDDGRARTMSYAQAGTEAFTLAGRQVQAIKLVQSAGNKQTLVWVVDGVPAPVRILQRENGRDTIDLRMQSIN